MIPPKFGFGFNGSERTGQDSRPDTIRTSIERIQENLSAADVRLTPDEIDEIDQRSAAIPVSGARASGHESYR